MLARRPLSLPTPRHDRIHARLRRLISEGVADFFADAFDIAQQQPEYRTSAHLVGHLLREVESATRQVLLNLPSAREYLARNPRVQGDTHLAEINAVLHALGLGSDAAAAEWRRIAGRKSEEGLHRLAHRDDLRRPRETNQQFDEAVERFVEVLDVVLDAAEANYVAIIRALDAVIGNQTPTEAQLDLVAVHLAPGVTALAHVFERLPAGWLLPLRERRVFSEPPEMVNHDDGSISLPYWPQAGYLARIAGDLPKPVTETILAIPVVGNESPHIEFLEAACRMPATDAARVATHELPWLGQRRWISGLLPVTVGKLVSHLIAGGERATAIELLRVSLHLRKREDGCPEPRFSNWSYAEMLCEQLPRLAQLSADAARDLLFELLDRAGADTPWQRRRIDGDARAGVGDPRDYLFEQLRDLYLRRAARGTVELRSAIEELESRRIPVYNRLALHLLQMHGQHALELVVERATDISRLSDDGNRSALGAMLRARIMDVSSEGQDRIIGALREASSEARLRAELGDRTGATREKVRQLARWQLLKWFHALGEARPVAINAEYESLREELGEPEWSVGAIRTGPNPPRTASKLAELNDDEFVDYLRDWVPPGIDPFEPSREDLGLEIKKCVEADVARFSRIARELRGMSSSYVANFFWGIHEHESRSNTDAPTLDWDSVLDLLEWVITQPAADTGWTWARRIGVDVLVDLVSASVVADDTPLTRAWAVVQVLMHDADPTPERDLERGNDRDSFAINTVRGQALHAAVEIGATLRDAGAKAPPGLLEQVVSAIVARANNEKEPSLGIRCVLSFEFNALYNLSPAAARDVANALLPTAGDLSADRRVGWQCFIGRNQAARATYGLLREAYAIAIANVGTVEPRDAQRLGDHLAWLAACGEIAFAESDGALAAYVHRAPADARHHALQGLGRSLHNVEGALPDAVVGRLREIWEWWAAAVIALGEPDELRAFGWWFTSPVFDQGWSLRTLDQVLVATGGQIDWQHEVVDKLVSFASAAPNAIASCLAKLVGTRHGLDVVGASRQIRSLIEALLPTAAGPAARTIAARLVARGRLDFRDLTE